jgi:hypothetical protein
VVFEGRGASGQWGIYRGRASGVLERVVDRTIALDGAFASQFSVWREAIADGRIAFRARIGTNDEIWVTPEPGAALAAAVALGAIALRYRVRPAGRAMASSRATSASTL